MNPKVDTEAMTMQFVGEYWLQQGIIPHTFHYKKCDFSPKEMAKLESDLARPASPPTTAELSTTVQPLVFDLDVALGDGVEM